MSHRNFGKNRYIAGNKRIAGAAAFLVIGALIISASVILSKREPEENIGTGVSRSDITGISDYQSANQTDTAADSAENMPDISDTDTAVKPESTVPLDTIAVSTEDENSVTELDSVTELVSEDELEEAFIDKLISEMTIEEKLGQMFMAAYNDVTAAENLEKYHFGAYILFAKDFENETPESISDKLGQLQESSKYGLITAVDEEGGSVTRISRFSQYRDVPFDSPRVIYSTGGIEAIRAAEREKAELLHSLGVNLNMAPVCDISTDVNDFMYYRSLGENAEITSEFVSAVIEEAREFGVGCVLKHFPGYGSVADTHTGIAYDYRSYSELAASDLIPFKAGIDSGAGAVLLSHIISYGVDSERPVSVSSKAVELLRGELGFDGVIVTDDLAMSGITNFSENGCAALDAISAGCDLLCCSNWAEQYPAVLQACESGAVSEARLDESVKRLLRLKLSLGIICRDNLG